jgi:hypothetical protein
MIVWVYMRGKIINSHPVGPLLVAMNRAGKNVPAFCQTVQAGVFAFPWLATLKPNY